MRLLSRSRSRNQIAVLDGEGDRDAMRVAGRLAREVLDEVAREVAPGVTTDWLDAVCHRACVERDVSSDYHYPTG